MIQHWVYLDKTGFGCFSGELLNESLNEIATVRKT